MGFKKTNIKKSTVVPNIIGIVSLCLVLTIGFVLIKNTHFFNFKIDKDGSLNPNQKTEQNQEKEEQEIEEQTKIEIKETKKDNKNNKVNILVVGRGGGTHDAPNLTDTIILASLNLETRAISMLSIPRDIYVEYPGKSSDGKINGLYALYSNESGSKSVGMNVLKDKISEITGEKIDYYINIDFEGFTKIIDTIGGIEITVPSHFVDNKYPDGNWGYKTLVFRKGTWIFDGENALKYARSRHSTSDFDRAMRQQQVIKAIKNKLTGSYFLTSPGKIKELYEVFINYVETDLTLKPIIKLAYNLNGKGDFKVLSSNINDSCFYGSNTCSKGGFLYTPSRDLFGGMSVLLVEGTNITKLSDYKSLHKYTDIVFNYPEIFMENYKINIFNGVKVNHLAGSLSNDIIRYGFNVPEKNSIGNTDEVYDKSIIYFNNIDENSATLKMLKKFFDGDFIKTETPRFSKNEANIEIVIGKDYTTKNNPFKF